MLFQNVAIGTAILCLIASTALSATARDPVELWLPQAVSATTGVAPLAAVYRSMVAGDVNAAEQQLEALHAQHPAVLPLWLALLTEQHDYAKIRQLVQRGLVSPTHTSAILAKYYQRATLPSLQFDEPTATLPLQSHWLVTLPRVKLQWRGRSYYFVLDTGASQSLVTDRVVKELALPLATTPTVAIDTATDIDVNAQLVQLPPFKFGPATAHHQLALVVEKDQLEQRFLGINWYQLDGIIGWPLLKQLDLTFDFSRQTVAIRQPIRTTRQGNLVWLFDDPMVISHDEQGARLWFLDTGAVNSVLTTHYLSAEQQHSIDWQQQRFNGLGGQGNSEKTAEFGPVKVTLPTLTKTFKHLQVRADHQDCVHSRCDGRLGVDIADNLMLHIDFTNARVDVTRGD